MKTKFLKPVIIFFIIQLFYANIFAQSETYSEKHSRHDNAKLSSDVIFNEISDGISSGNVTAISQYLSGQTYLNLLNGIGGYYSANQAYYVLEDFFKSHPAVSFDFSDIQNNSGNSFATGTYSYQLNGVNKNAQVYVSLKLAGKEWKITQISIN
jgi:Domain of unknown function (DUF4783)